MTWLRVFISILALSVLFAPTLAAVCPNGCICNTTRDGLHRATCSNLAELHKFTLRQKHHNINILDLSHNNITKVSHELDRLTEIVTLDLSTNGIQNLNKFLHNAKKLVHLSLANNRLETLSLATLPTSVSSLDLTNNILRNVPSDLGHLQSLEHLELEGNPLDCSCDNIIARDRLIAANVFIDNTKCASPTKFKNRSWLELKLKDICKSHKTEPDFMDMMMGDQPVDAFQIGQDANELKLMPLVSSSDLDDGKIIHGAKIVEDDDSLTFMRVGHLTSPAPFNNIEGSGSGDFESTTVSDFNIESRNVPTLSTDILESADDFQTTADPLEGSGEGSGFGAIFQEPEVTEETTTTHFYEVFNPGPVTKIFEDDTNKLTTEFPMPSSPSVYQGGPYWRNQKNPTKPIEKATSPTPRDTTVSEQIRVTHAPDVHGQAPGRNENNTPPHKTGTYVCIAIIVILLVGLIAFAITKGQMRKRRDRRILRQQKRDVEKASKEMVDMNKSLLGKPAAPELELPGEKRVNGKYELVPTHDKHQKKSENGDVSNSVNHNDSNGLRTDSPRDTNQNKSSSKDNNLAQGSKTPQQETSFDSAPASPDSRKDTHSLSSEDIFVPLNDEDAPRLNGNNDSDVCNPLINGDQNTDTAFLTPREYVPAYSPDTGRVRIKMSETPKPKTPVLVTRSRSNAGDIIITPADVNVRKS